MLCFQLEAKWLVIHGNLGRVQKMSVSLLMTQTAFWSDSDGDADDSPESAGEALLDHLLGIHFDGTLGARNL